MRVLGIVVSVGRLIGESKTAIVERDDAIARGGERGELVAPALHGRPKPMDQDEGRPVSRIDQAETRAIHRAVLGVECRARGISLRFGNRRGAARGCQQDAGDDEWRGPGNHESVCSALRASRRMRGCEVQSPVIASPSPDVTTTWASSITSTRSEEHTSELQSPYDLVCRLLL